MRNEYIIKGVDIKRNPIYPPPEALWIMSPSHYSGNIPNPYEGGLSHEYTKALQGGIIPRILQTLIGYFFHLLKTNTCALHALGILKPSRSQHCLDH